jgi:cyclase
VASDGYRVYIRNGSEPTDMTPANAARHAEACGAGEVVVNSIDRDGTMEGYDLDLIREVTDSVRIPVIASGGAGDYEDLVVPFREADASAVAAGSLFVYVGKGRAVLINYPDDEEIRELFANP